MTLDQLRIFAAVAERQHMTRAAEALNLSQSAVSAAVTALEQRHGAVLFHRVGRHIELTEAGSHFLAEARAVLLRAETAERVLADLSGLKRGRLSIHASQTIASYWLPGVLVRYRQAHPGIEIELQVGNTAQVAHAIAEGHAEIGFIEGAIDDPALLIEPVASDRLVILVGSEHELADQDRLSIADMRQGRWVLRERGSGTRSEFEAALCQFGIRPDELDIAFELPTNEAVRAAIIAGAGIGALSELVARYAVTAGVLKTLEPTLPARGFNLLRHPQRYRSKAAEALLDELRAAPYKLPQ